MPPSLRDWLPGDHLAWFVIETVAQMDLGAFYEAYRADGHGRAAHEPAMMVSLLTYAYSTGVYSSRGIERHCRQDIAYRVITANRVPDHATVARFVCRHQDALAGLFSEVLGLCDRAGLVECGVVALDGTKLRGNATRETSVDFGQIAQELIGVAIATDEAEDQEHGDARGDELPEELQSDQGRRAWLARELAARREAKREREREAEDDREGEDDDQDDAVAGVSLMPSRSSRGCRAGMGGCLRASANWTVSGGRRQRGCRARARIGCGTRLSAWSRISPRWGVGTTPISSGGRPRPTGSAARCRVIVSRSRTRRRCRRRRRSISAIPTRI